MLATIAEWIANNISWFITGILILICVIAALASRTKLAAYVREARTELLTKVTYPSREESFAHTWVVLVGVGITALYLFAVDFVLRPISDFIYFGNTPF